MRKAVLILVFYALFAPVTWLLRRFHDVLHLDWEPERETYFELSEGSR